MPRTIAINDPRFRTRTISIDLSDPLRYRIVIEREVVEEYADSMEIATRSAGLTVVREVIFNRQTGEPTGDPLVIALLAPISAAVTQMAANDGEQP